MSFDKWKLADDIWQVINDIRQVRDLTDDMRQLTWPMICDRWKWRGIWHKTDAMYSQNKNSHSKTHSRFSCINISHRKSFASAGCTPDVTFFFNKWFLSYSIMNSESVQNNYFIKDMVSLRKRSDVEFFSVTHTFLISPSLPCSSLPLDLLLSLFLSFFLSWDNFLEQDLQQ